MPQVLLWHITNPPAPAPRVLPVVPVLPVHPVLADAAVAVVRVAPKFVGPPKSGWHVCGRAARARPNFYTIILYR